MKKQIIQLLPKKIKYWLFRSQLNLPEDLPSPLRFKIAKTEYEYTEALKILYECYIEKSYTQENEDKIRVSLYHLLPTTTVIIALWHDEIIGTISLIRDNSLGLPVDKIYDLDFVRSNNKTLCEISSLAIKKSFRGKSGEILHPLIRYMWNYALYFFGIDYFVIAVNPAMQELYESIYLFKPLAKSPKADQYDFANNNPAVGEYVNLKNSFTEFEKQYEGSPANMNLYSFLRKAGPGNGEFPNRRYFSHIDSPASPTWYENFKKFLPNHPDQAKTEKLIANAYGYKNLSEMDNTGLSDSFRIPVTFKVFNNSETNITDISNSGLRLVTTQNLKTRKPILLDCHIGTDQRAKVLATPIWQHKAPNSQTQTYGLRIMDASSEWQKMLAVIGQDLNIPNLVQSKIS